MWRISSMNKESGDGKNDYNYCVRDLEKENKEQQSLLFSAWIWSLFSKLLIGPRRWWRFFRCVDKCGLKCNNDSIYGTHDNSNKAGRYQL